jgi:hypothetical protein
MYYRQAWRVQDCQCAKRHPGLETVNTCGISMTTYYIHKDQKLVVNLDTKAKIGALGHDVQFIGETNDETLSMWV